MIEAGSSVEVIDVLGWRIRTFADSMDMAAARQHLHDFFEQARTTIGSPIGKHRASVGFCILTPSGSAEKAFLGLWVFDPGLRLMQLSLSGENLAGVGIDLSLESVRVLSSEVRLMERAVNSETEFEAICRRYLAGTSAENREMPAKSAMLATLTRFSSSWFRGDIDGLLAEMSPEPAYRTSSGGNFEGRAAVREALTQMCKPGPAGREPEPPDSCFFANKSLSYWCLDLPKPGGGVQNVKGVDLITYDTDGRILLKDAYRKVG